MLRGNNAEEVLREETLLKRATHLNFLLPLISFYNPFTFLVRMNLLELRIHKSQGA